MKYYGDYPGASMSMVPDQLQHDLLVQQIKKHHIKVCVETGTYLGLGSTQSLIKAFLEAYDNNPPRTLRVVTCEANHENYEQAKRNLTKWSFIEPILGSTMSAPKIKEFITNDDPLINPQSYPDIYYDGQNNCDMRWNYISESCGAMDLSHPEWFGENILAWYLNLLAIEESRYALIVLDSAGGLGYLEFQEVMKVMANVPFTIMCDDVHHLKHFRSLEIMKTDHRFTLLGNQNGWGMAEYQPC